MRGLAHTPTPPRLRGTGAYSPTLRLTLTRGAWTRQAGLTIGFRFELLDLSGKP